MTGNRVLVIGGGIAGPVLSIFLKKKGFEPIVFERLSGPSDAGLSLASVAFVFACGSDSLKRCEQFTDEWFQSLELDTWTCRTLARHS